MNKKFGFSNEVFINQDEGTFVAFPYTFAKGNTGVTLETEVRDGKEYVLAGSLVKEGTVPLGIVPEEYCISDGLVAGRIVLAGYCYLSRLTKNARNALSVLSDIVAMPYNQVVVYQVRHFFSKGTVSLTHLVLKVEGSAWAEPMDKSMFSLPYHDQLLKSVERKDDFTIELIFDGIQPAIEIKSVLSEAFSISTQLPIKGFPIRSISTEGGI